MGKIKNYAEKSFRTSRKIFILAFLSVASITKPVKSSGILDGTVITANTILMSHSINILKDLKERSDFLKSVEKHFLKKITDKLLKSEYVAEFAKEQEKSHLLKKILENNDTISGLEKKLLHTKIFFLLNLSSWCGFMGKLIFETLSSSSETSKVPPSIDKSTTQPPLIPQIPQQYIVNPYQIIPGYPSENTYPNNQDLENQNSSPSLMEFGNLQENTDGSISYIIDNSI